MTQSKFFERNESIENLPEGMRYRAQLIARAEEKALIARVRELPFKEFDFHGFKGKRRTVSFGWQYEFSGRGRLQKAFSLMGLKGLFVGDWEGSVRLPVFIALWLCFRAGHPAI